MVNEVVLVKEAVFTADQEGVLIVDQGELLTVLHSREEDVIIWCIYYWYI